MAQSFHLHASVKLGLVLSQLNQRVERHGHEAHDMGNSSDAGAAVVHLFPGGRFNDTVLAFKII